jgi:hypothetical protein
MYEVDGEAKHEALLPPQDADYYCITHIYHFFFGLL